MHWASVPHGCVARAVSPLPDAAGFWPPPQPKLPKRTEATKGTLTARTRWVRITRRMVSEKIVTKTSPRLPYVRAFAAGRASATLASQVVSVTVGWQLYERTHDAWSLGLVGVFELAPVLFLMLPAGNAADTFPRRNVAMFAHALLAAASLGLALVSRASAPVATIYALLVLVGAARAFASPSVGTILPSLIPPAELAPVNAWLTSTFEIAAISGPALGGFLIGVTGGATASFAVATIGQLIFVATLATLPAKAPPKRAERRSAAEIFGGFSFIFAQPIFLAAITLDLFAVLLGGAVALLPVFQKDILHASATELGWLRAAPSIGALVMTVILARRKPFARPGVTLLLAVAGFGVATIGFGLSRSLPLSLVCLFLTGAFDAVSVVIRMTLEQLLTPEHLRGRVSSVNYVFIGFSNELGSFESGSTAKLFGPVASVVGGGVGTILVVLLVSVVFPVLAKLGPLAAMKPADEVEAAGSPGTV